MYSRKQVEVAEEHGVVLKAIPVLDLSPFDRIFLDTQAVEEGHRICRVFVPTSSFNCSCHRDVPIFKRRNKLIHTLVDENGKKFVEDVFDVYTHRVKHSHYCSKLTRYRYESDYKDDSVKYRPKKNHIQFVGQDDALNTVSYTFEKDETVFIVEHFGDTYPQYETIPYEEDLVDRARCDDEIDNLDRYFNYVLGSWDSDCSRIHHHRDNEGSETIGGHIEIHFANLKERINDFQTRLETIDRLDEKLFLESKEDQHRYKQTMAYLKSDMRYILRKFHYDLYDMGNIWDYVTGDMSFEVFVLCVDLIQGIKERLDEKNLELAVYGLMLHDLTVDDYYWILYEDKLKRKYEMVV